MPTKEEIKHRIEVMQAWLDGKTIQTKLAGEYYEWHDLPCPSFDGFGIGTEYRVKPELKEIWVNEYEGPELCAFPSKAEALRYFVEGAIRVAVKYREVIEGE